VAASVTVTFAIRTYNRPVLLRRAIEDVLAQTFDDWQIAIFNNGGEAAPVEAVVAEFADQLDGRVKIEHGSGQLSLGESSNRAIAGGDGEFFVLHDDDDTLDPTFLERTVTHLRAAKEEVCGVATRCERIDEVVNDDGTISEIARAPHNPYMDYVSLETVLIANPFPPICFLVRRSAFDAVGGNDPELDQSHDWLFLIRLLSRFKVDVIPEVLAFYHHRQQPGSAYGNSVQKTFEVALERAKMRDRLVGEAVRDGTISPAQIVVASSEAHLETRAAVEELLDRTRELQLLAGDIDNRLKHVHGFLEKHDAILGRLDRLMSPATKVRQTFTRNGGK
jgi:glycosyltransferase involved in cell wall biosynthesis